MAIAILKEKRVAIQVWFCFGRPERQVVARGIDTSKGGKWSRLEVLR
jgi:hypothetical protein